MLKPSRLSFYVSLAVMGLLIWSWTQVRPKAVDPGSPGWVLIQGASVFDGLNPALLPPCDVLIHDGVIVSVDATGQSLPAETQIVPAQGLTLMPSFTDLGSLASMQGNFPEEKVPGLMLQTLHIDLGSGVGAELDLNSSVAQAETPLGLDLPAIKCGGPTLSTLGGWRPGPLGDPESPVLEIADKADLQRALRLLHGAGAQLILLSMENIALVDPPYSDSELAELGDLASAAHLPIIAYAEHTAAALHSLKARPRLLLGPLAYEAVTPDFIAALKATHCAYAPGLNSLLAFWPWPHGLARMESFSEAPLLNARMRSSLSDPDQLSTPRQTLDESGASQDLALQNTFQIWQGGVALGLASFSGAAGVPHGLGARSEIAFMLDAGLPLPALMVLATSGSAAIGGFEGSGQVKAGFQANLILVKGDPLSDPAAHRRVRLVLRRGKLWIPRELRRL